MSKDDLNRFKRQVKGFIKWKAETSEKHIDGCINLTLKEVTYAKTFEEVHKILRMWGSDETFMKALLEEKF